MENKNKIIWITYGLRNWWCQYMEKIANFGHLYHFSLLMLNDTLHLNTKLFAPNISLNIMSNIDSAYYVHIMCILCSYYMHTMYILWAI